MTRVRFFLAKILFRGRQVPAQVAIVPLLAIEMVDSRTEVAHRVSDEAFAAGRCDGGRYRTVCGELVLPASLTAPARGHCLPCERGSALTRKRGGIREDRQPGSGAHQATARPGQATWL